MTVLLTLLLCNNYKSYCLNNIKADTIIVMHYAGRDGLFIDKQAVIRITKKSALGDSLFVINKLNEAIIKRQKEQINNGKQFESKFNQYLISSDKEKQELNRKYNLKILGKNILLGMSTTAITILGILYFLK